MYDTYPRPQLKRKNWQSLNGRWSVNGKPCEVPSCQSEERLLYRRSFEFRREKARVLLHFGAADQIAEVYLNERFLGEHRGGYTAFSFDISDSVREGTNELTVRVTDTLDHTYPWGKQKKKRGGMWYTPMSGLWQSVWIEQVPPEYISAVRITPDLSGAELTITVRSDKGESVRHERIEVEQPEWWTPENPRLYYRTLKQGEDEAEIYFALRTVELREIDGVSRVCLNGKPVFLNGVLDQGYFEKGLMLPEDPAEYERDVLRMKALGFNLLRKHIKVEPEDFYFACDRLGMLVMQDMVNSGDYRFFKDTVLGTLGVPLSDKIRREDERTRFFEAHCLKIQDQLCNHPCVIAYTVFNEGWGQFNSDAMYEKLKARDPGRLYDSASGWFAQEKSDFDSLHIYFRLKRLRPGKRPLFVTECGGYSLNLSARKKSYGYGKCRDSAELTDRILKLYREMILPAVPKGCCGCIYTQLSDIEDEINGLYSYDRGVCKVDAPRLAEFMKLAEEAIPSRSDG